MATKKTATKAPVAPVKTTRVGFQGFRKPEKIAAETLKGVLDRVDDDLFVFWTGGNYGRRRNSLRSQALQTIKEAKKPIALRELLNRAAHAAGAAGGFDPQTVKGGLSLHQIAKPCVYLYLIKNADGDHVAYRDIPNPDPTFSAKPIAGGSVVLKGGKPAVKAAAA